MKLKDVMLYNLGKVRAVESKTGKIVAKTANLLKLYDDAEVVGFESIIVVRGDEKSAEPWLQVWLHSEDVLKIKDGANNDGN